MSSCLSETDPKRDIPGQTLMSKCFCGETGWVGKDVCWPDYPVPGQQSEVRESPDCEQSCFTFKNHRIRCYKRADQYPDSLQSHFDCCTGKTEVFKCDPRYCPTDHDPLPCNATFAQFCSGDKINTNYQQCQRLLDTELGKKNYAEYSYKYCVDDNPSGVRFRDTICRDYCQKNPTACESKLREICKDKNPTQTEWVDICGCYYPLEVYTTFFKSLDDQYNLPSGTSWSSPECGFPQCKVASYQSKDPKNCPIQSIVTCVATAKVDVTGAIVKDSPITINISPECQGKYTPKKAIKCSQATEATDCPKETPKCVSEVCKQCRENTDCVNPEKPFCSSGVCVECKDASQCPAERPVCRANICVQEEEPAKKGFPIWAWFLIGFIVLALFGVIVFFSRKKQPTAAEAAPAAPKKSSNSKLFR